MNTIHSCVSSFLITLLTALLVQSCSAGSGNGRNNPSASDTIPPSQPSNLTLTVVNSSRIDLSWTASTDNVRVAGYQVWRGNTPIATVNTTSYSDTGLSECTTYTYTVKAFDAADNVSADSSPSSAKTTPAILMWDAPTLYANGSPLSADEITGYRVYIGTSSNFNSTVSFNQVSADTRSIIVRDLNLKPGMYYFVVTTLVSPGRESDYSEEASVIINGLCAVDSLP